MTSPRLIALVLIALFAGCAPTITPEASYREMLPQGAQDVRSQTISAGIDYSYFLKAKIAPAEFTAFVRTLGLNEGGMQDVNLQEDEVRTWWSPKRDGIYYGLAKRNEKSDAVRALLWATYENGYLYFKYTDF